jgi:hypothetical protein
MKATKTYSPLNYLELSAEECAEIMELSGQPAPARSNEEWLHLLRQRLARQQREFAALLDQAAEHPGLLAECAQFRREIQNTRQRLADCRALRSRRN